MSSETFPAVALDRLPRRVQAQMVPAAMQHELGLFIVDATWGTLTPIQLAPGVRTVAELEVIEHLEAGLPLIDTRLAHFHRDATIPGACCIPHEEIAQRLDSLDPTTPTIFFCNGPQCAATPQAIDRLLAAGYPADAIAYYRGGIHDWITLGLPVRPGDQLDVPKSSGGSHR